jgi:type I restriction enzyme R subunit
MFSNFSFLEREFPLLHTIGISAESYLHSDPVYCLVKLRLFSEKMTEILFNEHALDFPADNSFHNRLELLKEEKLLPLAVKDLLSMNNLPSNMAHWIYQFANPESFTERLLFLGGYYEKYKLTKNMKSYCF